MEIANSFCEEIKQGKEDLLLNRACYPSSKALINACTRWILVPSVKQGQQVYVVCPGNCQTNMGGAKAPRTPGKSAETPIYLTNLPFEVNDEIQGKFLRDKQVTNWVDKIPPY